MNANINYDEIPDTSAVQEDLLAALSSQHVTVHTNEEPDFDYMENGDVAFVVKNPHNDENLLIELGGEFSLFFGLWHGQYKAVEYDYDRMKKDIAAILAGNAGALCTQGHHLLQLGHHIVCHLIAEFPDLLRAVADAVHAHIGKLTVVVIAHHPGLCIQVLHDLAVQLVQFGTVGVKITGLGLVGGAAHGRVQILLVRAQLRDGELFAVQLHQCAAVDLLVAAHQSIELLLQLHGAVIHAQHGILHASHAGGAKGFGQRIHMGVGQKCPADLHPCVFHGGTVGIKEVLLSLPVFIAGVAGVVDVGKVRGGVVLCKGFALLVVEPDKGIAVRCGSGLCGQLFAPGQQGTDVRAGIGHFVEFHRETFLSGRRLHI